MTQRVVHFSPQLLQRFHHRKRAVTGKWHVDETYIKVRGQWMYLCGLGDTVEFHSAAAPGRISWTDLGSGTHTARSITRPGIW
jgi:hypothetical protein